MGKHLKPSKEQILSDLRQVAVTLGRTPTYKEYGKLSAYGGSRALRICSAGWNEVLRMAGLKVANRVRFFVVPAAELINDIRRVARLVGHAPTVGEYGVHVHYAQRTLELRLGPKWKDVITSAGLVYKRRHSFKLSESQMRQDLERVRDQLGRLPTVTDYEEFGSHDTKPFYRFCEESMRPRKWAEVLILLLHCRREDVLPPRLEDLTREELINEVKKVKRQLWETKRQYRLNG